MNGRQSSMILDNQEKNKNRFPEQRQDIPERVVKIFYNEEFDPGSG